ncbi:hypothetical protein VFMJ11_B0109 (plasmid) [Aliivibrio fischeri MJ11]|uniref:Uncharacterized protein n=1 Tax=Aliivibrio fischeri (strain MJ11) TaxID=388396 RepID=B5EW52_ALIFM|nr:hypothetical protein [Aliivibrio fischeri]ACH64811.1 hypothetical protein VFMJ11_B0109 [Aliivibrio fischeri MJ11]
MMVRSFKKQKGIGLIETFIAVIIMTIVFAKLTEMWAEENQRSAITLQGQRLATIANAVVHYQSSGGDSSITPPRPSPLAQWNIAGQPFENGAVHLGLDWLKSQLLCGGSANSPVENLHCNTLNDPFLGGDTIYRFEISNDGTIINTRIQIVQRTNHANGIQSIEGTLDRHFASEIAVATEKLVSFSSMGSTNSFFTATNTAIVQGDIGLNVANTPFLRRDGLVTATGTQVFEDGAGIEGAETISAERFADYDRATDTVSTTHFIDMDGDSALERLSVEELSSPLANIDTLTSTFIDSDGAIINTAEINDLTIEYIQQTDASVQNQFAGQVKVGNATDNVTLSEGDISMTGTLINADDDSYFIDMEPTGVSRLNDIVLTSLGNRSISDVMPKLSLQGVKMVAANDLLPLPVCASGGSPRLLITPKRWSTIFLDNGAIKVNNNINYIDADIVGTNWQVLFKTHDVSDPALGLIDDPNGLGLAEVYCYYP